MLKIFQKFNRLLEMSVRVGRSLFDRIEPCLTARHENGARDLQTALAKTTWADPHCRSWYKNADGRITQNWSSHTRDYAAATANVNLDDYATHVAAAAE